MPRQVHPMIYAHEKNQDWWEASCILGTESTDSVGAQLPPERPERHMSQVH